MKIFIADDSRIDSLALQSIVEENNNEAVCVENGQELLELINSSSSYPDLILLDIMMPKLDGFEVCKILKSNDLTKQIPIIFLTSKISVEDEIKGLQFGAVDFIRKPFHDKIVQARLD